MTTLVLKIIACVTMLIDHLTACLYDVARVVPVNHQTEWIYQILRGIGRMAFPVYCFFLIQGVIHTKSKWRYIVRIGIFALISEIPFDLALQGNWFVTRYQNVDFTLLFGLSAVMFLQWASRWKGNLKILGYVLFAAITVGLGILANRLRVDYGMGGVFQIAIMGLLTVPLDEIRPGLSQSVWFRVTVCAIAIFVCSFVSRNSFELLALAALPFLALYNGKPGPKNKLTKWGGYLFYPVHLAVLAMILVVPRLMGW
ncbi:MAG: hypothetical protein J5794_02635 [Lachnospiraceae bacterium]|nr:hypothetical protein [Lachnospiraceae bacterium]